MGLESQISEYLSPQRFVPPPGPRRPRRRSPRRRHPDAGAARPRRGRQHPLRNRRGTPAFLETLGGGCQNPVGAYARVMGQEMLLTVFLSNPEATQAFTAKVEGLKHDPRQQASDAYLAVIERGGANLVRGG